MQPISRSTPPGLRTLQNYGVNVSGVEQVFWQPLYDRQVYPAAGFQTRTFFQSTKGSANSTEEDTNMKAAGALPARMSMLVTAIELAFYSGASTSLTGNAATVAANQIADYDAVRSRGHVQFNIGSKAFLDEVALENFPTGVALAAESSRSDQTTPAADLQSITGVANFVGRRYEIVPLELESVQNFDLTLKFENGAVALPSGVDGVLIARLCGYQYRSAQ